ncbi:MAG: hypothetical protein WA850_04905, partial [Xanthobacteraceae bacterium]
MIGALLLAMTIAPAIAVIGCILSRGPRVAEAINLASSIVVLVAAVPLAVASAGGPNYYLGRYVVLDITGAWVILCTAVVYLLASIYSIG